MSSEVKDERTAEDSPPPREGGDRAQYGVCVFLALLGTAVIVDALGIPHITSGTDPVGPRAVPLILGALLVLLAVLYAVDVARGGRGEPEAARTSTCRPAATGAPWPCWSRCSWRTRCSSSGSAG